MSKSDKNKRTNTETARRIWLAGIGAYGRAFAEAQEALKEVTDKGGDIFDDLVQKGEMIEKVVEYKGKEMLEKTREKTRDFGDIDVPSLDIDDRIKRMRSRLSLGSRASHADTIEDRLAMVEAKLEAVLEQLAPPAPKKASKKTPAKKVVAKESAPKKKATTQRTPKKPTAKKTTTKKTTGKK